MSLNTSSSNERMSEDEDRSNNNGPTGNDRDQGPIVVGSAQESHSAPVCDNADSTSGQVKLSKKQLKRLEKKKKFEKLRPIKRKEERERLKQKRAEARERGENLGPTRKTLRRNTMKDSNCRLRVALDCSFDDLMPEKAVNSLTVQIQRCYSVNRRATDPLQFYVCGIDGKTKTRMESIGDYRNWDIHLKDEIYTECFAADEIIYLTSESNNVITELDVNKVYIIGGLVDHNKEKGLCHRLAEEKGLAHGQLPISEFIEMRTRKVLTVDHVFEILLHYEESKNWEEAFFKVLPKRKGAVPKVKQDQELSEGNNAENGEKDCDKSVNNSDSSQITQNDDS